MKNNKNRTSSNGSATRATKQVLKQAQSASQLRMSSAVAGVPAANVSPRETSADQVQSAALAEALGLSTAQHLALDLISLWESLSPRECCRDGLRATLEASFDDMEYAATNSVHRRRPVKPRERAWALKFYPHLKNLFRKTGFENAYNATASAGENSNAVKRVKSTGKAGAR